MGNLTYRITPPQHDLQKTAETVHNSKHPAPRTATLVIDQGTHASRALLFDETGRKLHAEYRRIGLTRHPDGRVEQDATEILDSVNAVLTAALHYANTKQIDIAYAALSTQRSTVVAWHRATGNPLVPAISWQDTRTADELERFKDDAQDIRQRTGLRLSPHYGASKLKWWLDHEPRVRKASEDGSLVFGPLASFLLFHLVKDRTMAVDDANASRTLLWNIQSRDWDPALLDLFGINKDHLPQCRPIRGSYGMLNEAPIPLTAVGGDQPAMLYANGAPQPHTAYINIGSGAFILVPTGGQLVRHGKLLSGVANSANGDVDYYIEGTVNGAGTAVDWAKAHWGKDLADHDLETGLVEQREPPIFLNAIGGLGSPWWRPDIGPAIIGRDDAWCLRNPMRCIIAVLESIVFMLYTNLNEVRHTALGIERIKVSGGLAKLDGLCQRLADLSGLPVSRSKQTEATAAGMAWLASVPDEQWLEVEQQCFKPQADPELASRYRSFLASIEDGLRN